MSRRLKDISDKNYKNSWISSNISRLVSQIYKTVSEEDIFNFRKAYPSSPITHCHCPSLPSLSPHSFCGGKPKFFFVFRPLQFRGKLSLFWVLGFFVTFFLWAKKRGLTSALEDGGIDGRPDLSPSPHCSVLALHKIPRIKNTKMVCRIFLHFLGKPFSSQILHKDSPKNWSEKPILPPPPFSRTSSE